MRGVLGLKISFPPTELAGIRKLSLALYQEMTGLGKKNSYKVWRLYQKSHNFLANPQEYNMNLYIRTVRSKSQAINIERL